MLYGNRGYFKIKQFKTEIEQLKTENQNLLNDNQNMHQQLQELGAFDYYKILDMTEQLKRNMKQKANCSGRFSETSGFYR